MNKLRPGFARIQFFSVKPEIDELLEKGHTLRSAYEALLLKNKITMTYDTFRRNVRKFVYKLNDTKKKYKKNINEQNTDICIIQNKDIAELKAYNTVEITENQQPFGKEKIGPKDVI